MELMKSYVTKNECYQVARKIDVEGLPEVANEPTRDGIN